MRIKNKFFIGLMLIPLLFISTSKDVVNYNEGDNNNKITYELNVDETALTIEYKSSKKINATTNHPGSIKYYSKGINYATVDDNGLVTGVQPGKVDVYAYVDSNNDNKFDENVDLNKKIEVTVFKEVKVSKEINAKFYDSFAGFEGIEDLSSIDLEELLVGKDIKLYNINYEGEVPYIDVEDLGTLIKYLHGFSLDTYNVEEDKKGQIENEMFKVSNEGSGIYKYETFTQNGLEVIQEDIIDNNKYGNIYIDIDNSTIYSDNYAKFRAFYSQTTYNNDIPNDIASPFGIISTSEKTEYITEPKSRVAFDYKKYGINFYKIGEKSYIPFQIIVPHIADFSDIYYDGNKSIFKRKNYLTGSQMPQMIFNYFDSSKDFIKFDNLSASLDKTKSTEDKLVYTNVNLVDIIDTVRGLYDYYTLTTFEIDKVNKTFSYTSGNSIFKSIKKRDPIFDETKREGSLKYVENDKAYIVYSERYYPDLNEYKKEPITFIPKEEGKINHNQFAPNLKTFNNAYLYSYLDYFYGIKDVAGVNSYEDYFSNNSSSILLGDGIYKQKDTIKNHLINASTPDEYNIVLTFIFSKYLGDGHTNLFAATNYGSASQSGTYLYQNISESNISERYLKLLRYYSKYKKQRDVDLDAEDKVDFLFGDGYLGGMEIEDETAVIRFDSFNSSPIDQEGYKSIIDNLKNPPENPEEEEEIPDEEKPTTIEEEIGQILLFDTFIGITIAFDYIEKQENVKNVVFDITLNGGGTALTVPQLMAFMTKDIEITTKYTLDGSITKYAYKADLNCNNVYAEDADTYEGKYNFYILTSEYSFSCGSLLPAICKTTNCAKIIGKQSGGGACSVNQSNDTLGSTYQISSPYCLMYKLNDKYIDDDKGVEVDYELDSSYWYDITKLNNKLKEFSV